MKFWTVYHGQSTTVLQVPGKHSHFPPVIPTLPQPPGRLSEPSPHRAPPHPNVPRMTTHLLLCVTSFPLLRCHRHFSIDTFGPTNRHQTSPLLLVRLVFHFCNSKPADREDGDLSLTPWAALFGLVGGFYEVPPLVPTPMTYVPLDSTTHCVQMVATDVLSRGASRRQGPRTHRRAPGSAGSHGAIGERGKGRTGYLKEIPAKALSPSET